MMEMISIKHFIVAAVPYLKIQATTDQCQETFRILFTRSESCHNHVKLCFGYGMAYHYSFGGCYGG